MWQNIDQIDSLYKHCIKLYNIWIFERYAVNVPKKYKFSSQNNYSRLLDNESGRTFIKVGKD